jgi:hypothetical protein
MNTNTGETVHDFGYSDVAFELGMYELENGDIALIGNNITIIDTKTFKKISVVEDIQAVSIIQLSDGSFVINTSLADMFHYSNDFTHIFAQGRCNCDHGLIEYSPGTILRVAPASAHVDRYSFKEDSTERFFTAPNESTSSLHAIANECFVYRRFNRPLQICNRGKLYVMERRQETEYDTQKDSKHKPIAIGNGNFLCRKGTGRVLIYNSIGKIQEEFHVGDEENYFINLVLLE